MTLFLPATRPAAAVPGIGAQASTLEVAARETPEGARLRLLDLQLEPGEPRVALDLHRFRVFAPEARVVVRGAHGAAVQTPPANAYFRGRIEGEPDSRVLLTVLEQGGVRGVVMRPEGLWILGKGAAAGGPAAGMGARRVAGNELAGGAAAFACGVDSLPLMERLAPGGAASASAAGSGPSRAGGPGTGFTATVAVETDVEFFQLFGDASAAASYVGDLFAYASSLYSAEVDTALEVGSISLWTGAADPWEQTDASCALYEFARYWNDNMSAESRTFAHFLSGRSFGGVAFVGVLCSGEFNVNHGGYCPGLAPDYDNYGGAYGVSGGLSGSFDLQNPMVVWDVQVVAHEIGHNFEAPHTHCFAGLEGHSEPVDACYTGQCGSPGCACGASQLPSGCPGGGQGCGTIMSYCHLQSGGSANISWSLGAGHAYGVAPERVPALMLGHVEESDALYPGCLSPLNTAPQAAADSYSTFENVDLSVTSPGVLANDDDAEGDPLTAVLVSAPASGSLTLNADGSLVYSPSLGFTGLDSFSYRANDGRADSTAVTVDLEVSECSGTVDLTLADDSVSTPQTHQACRSITVGPSYRVESGGDLSLTAATVILEDGFSLDTGGRLRISLIP